MGKSLHLDHTVLRFSARNWAYLIPFDLRERPSQYGEIIHYEPKPIVRTVFINNCKCLRKTCRYVVVIKYVYFAYIISTYYACNYHNHSITNATLKSEVVIIVKMLFTVPNKNRKGNSTKYVRGNGIINVDIVIDII